MQGAAAAALPWALQQGILSQQGDGLGLPCDFCVDGREIGWIDKGARMMAWLCSEPRPDHRVWAISPLGNARRRLVLAFCGEWRAPPVWPVLTSIASRLHEAFDPASRPARDGSLGVAFCPRTGGLYLACDGSLELGSGEALLVDALSAWLKAGPDVGEMPRADLDRADHPASPGGRLPLPGAGGVLYLGRLPLGQAPGAPQAPQPCCPDPAELARFCPELHGERKARDAAPLSAAARCWSAPFKRFMRDRAARSGEAVRDNANRAGFEVAAQLDATRRGYIDLSGDQPAFGPGFLMRPGLVEALVDECSRDRLPVFEALREQLDQVVAYNSSTQTFFMKRAGPGGRALLDQGIHKAAMLDKFRIAGLRWKVPKPEDEAVMLALLENLPGFMTKKGPKPQYDVFEWYLHCARRTASGTRFFPLGPGEVFPERDAYINLFRGWNAFRLVPGPLQGGERLPVGLDEPLRPGLHFLLCHVAHCMGESWAEARELLEARPEEQPASATARFMAFWANMLFTPRDKWPEYWILRGGQGVGKSSLVNAMRANLLNEEHCATFMDAARLTDDKNGHLMDKVLVLLEEASPNDLDSKGGNKIKEFVSGTRAYFRELFKDGFMGENYTRFIFITNEIFPATITPGDRRTRLAAFNLEVERRLQGDASVRHHYTTTLFATLNDQRTWRDTAAFLWERFSRPEQLKVYATAVHDRSTGINPATLNLQLESMDRIRDTSVLGWLYRCLLYHEGFFPEDPETHFVLEHPGRPCQDWLPYGRGPQTEFNGRWRELGPAQAKDSPGTNGERRRLRATGFWTRGTVAEFYESYGRRVDLRQRWSEEQFVEAVRMLFGGLADEKTPEPYAMRESSIAVQGRQVRLWFLPPLRQLEELFVRALPTVQGVFKWDEFRRFKEQGAARAISQSRSPS